MPSSYFKAPNNLKNPEQMFAKLAERKAEAEARLAVQAPVSAAVSTPAALAWAEPVRHGDGTGFQLSVCGRWSVVAERIDGWAVFRLFSRLPIPTLVLTRNSAQEAREEARLMTINPSYTP